MASRPTVADVAREAGVSVATVDRVVNARLPVREDTAKRVLDAATRVGFHATGLIRSRLRPQLPEHAVGLLLQRPDDPFYRELGRGLEAAITASRLFRGTALVDHWVADDPDDIAERLLRLGRRTDAVALVSPDYPRVEAAIAELTGRGVPVFTLLSDCATASRTAYLGIDSRKAGRTAGWFVRRCAARPGKVAIIVGNRRFQGHELREIGFRTFFREHAPNFTVLDAVVNAESDAATEVAVAELVAAHPDLVGVYVAGGGMAGGIAALRRVEAARRPAMVCPSLTPAARAALADGIVEAAICEPVDRLADRLAELTFQALDERPARLPHQVILPMDLHTPENL